MGRNDENGTAVNVSSKYPDAEEVVAKRSGDVLLSHTILKSDHFPGCQNTKLRPLVDGAPNFRAVEGLPVYGVAIPTVSGLRNVLSLLGAEKGRRRVVWVNMREEPVLYVNGNPFVVRESDKPFANLEYTGIDTHRVEEMENRLKMDVLTEAAKYDGSVIVAHEDDQFQVVEDWEAVTEVDVQSPADVYHELCDDGYNIDYVRVPVTDEKAPDGQDFEIIMKKCWHVEEGDAIIFNCQMGRGRTTTGMCIACMLILRKKQAHLSLPPLVPSDDMPKWWCYNSTDGDIIAASPRYSTDDLKSGMFVVIRSLLRVLENGKMAKISLDLILDACAAMQNLREAIAVYRAKIFHERNELRRQSLLQVCLEYLDRYYTLIVFSSYLDDKAFSPGTSEHTSFTEWVLARPELKAILLRLLRSNPLNALDIEQDNTSVFSKSKETNSQGDIFGEYISKRAGSVLGPYTTLKLDHFEGCESSRIINPIKGAPNFRGISDKGFKVYGGAIATVDGTKRVLASVGAAPEDESNIRAVWHMMREEPVIYINGDPYVLREASRPFKNLMEYKGIDSNRLDKMEQRLKEDIIEEASKYNGKIAVTVEHIESDGNRVLKDEFVKIENPAVVETPREAVGKLQSQGYRVTFIRIPLTDGTCPKPADFDEFYAAAAAARPTDALIYTCQLGGGRTTMGMCIGTLLRMHLNGVDVPKPTEIERSSALQRLDEDVGGTSPPHRIDENDEYGLQGPFPATPGGDVSSPRNVSIDPERKNMEDGEYVGVRKFTRTLEMGLEAKAEVDAVIDACGLLVNLRTAIVRYRKPKSVEAFFRPELQTRHSAFQRGSAYMERYCMLMAFSVYLRLCQQKGRTLTFEDWICNRTDISAARDAIHQNPARALAPIPVPPENTPAALSRAGYGDRRVSSKEERKVLMRRRGSVLGRRSILKSYTVSGDVTKMNVPANLLIDGISDIRCALHCSILTVGNATVRGLRILLDQLNSLSNGDSRVVITDLREELVLYVNGVAYLRRELEMPAAALHHAGIQANKLEDLELRLRSDMISESIAWGGKVLLHEEISKETTVANLFGDNEGKSNGDNNLEKYNSFKNLKGDDYKEDITKTTSYQTTMHISPFWESAGSEGDIDSGLCTPTEIFSGLAAEGYDIQYRRVPLSRERTPRASDLDLLHQQVHDTQKDKKVYYIFVSRTATGSSARFATAFACCCLMKKPLGPDTESIQPSKKPKIFQATAVRHDSESSELSRSVEIGEYRAIMNLCRVLPSGVDAKKAVDEAIEQCKDIGNLKEDILKCKQISEEDSEGSTAAAARRLGLHYLQRYFYLIAFRAFLEQDKDDASTTFNKWVSERKEISYLSSVLDLE